MNYYSHEGFAVSVLMDVIDHNLSKPKPHHMNKDIMTTILKLERNNGE